MHSISSSILLPVSLAAAFQVITDLKTIIRLSPFFSLKSIEPSSGRVAQIGERLILTIEYYATKNIETHAIEIDRLETNRLISYAIGSGVIRTIRYGLEPVSGGIQLTQTFELDAENESLIKGTQDELDVWLRSVGNYLKISERNSLSKQFQKWFMDSVWLKLTISERTIALIMVKISVLELVLLLILVLIWNTG
ncbi:MAG: hypothetical protein HZB62_13350 [Nitrospirae bacterium]|nr:hypothetical protein [Nitrospirota bacterium]